MAKWLLLYKVTRTLFYLGTLTHIQQLVLRLELPEERLVSAVKKAIAQNPYHPATTQ